MSIWEFIGAAFLGFCVACALNPPNDGDAARPGMAERFGANLLAGVAMAFVLLAIAVQSDRINVLNAALEQAGIDIPSQAEEPK